MGDVFFKSLRILSAADKGRIRNMEMNILMFDQEIGYENSLDAQ